MGILCVPLSGCDGFSRFSILNLVIRFSLDFAHTHNQVWNLVGSLEGAKCYKCKWIYNDTRMKLFTTIKLNLLQSIFDKLKELTLARSSRHSDA